MLRFRNLITSLAIGFTLMDATAQANDRSSVGKTPLTEDFASFVTEILDKWKVPGLSIAVIDGDQVFAEV
jgi:CubicO group peptidase (beta-lactamase class C family)